MRICATVAEFNPFHNGHAYLLNANHGDFDCLIAIMSGNFVQRGAPGIYDKFSRARAAVLHGADLVIELPVLYALSSAENFAMGAVRILNATNCVDTLLFGSECGEIAPLAAVSDATVNESENFKSALKESLASGMTYPKAQAAALSLIGIDPDLLSMPNNILGIEYLKALKRTSSPITPLTIKRYGAAHDSNVASGSIASASHVRKLIEKGSFTQNFMPPYPYPAPVFEKQFSDIVLYALRSISKDELLKISDCSPSLAARFIKARNSTDPESVVSAIKTKNFTESRIRRVIWNMVLKNDLSPDRDPSYIRILAQNERGAAAISYMKGRAKLPIVLKGAMLKDDPLFALEAKATDIYNIPRKIPSGEDFRHSPVLI